jgi:hypothetical protein
MLRFFFQGDPFREAGKSIAKGSLLLGLFLIGFGMLVFILRDIFAFLAAAVFFMAGFSAIGYAIRIFWASRRRTKPEDAYRDNVQIHIRDPFE